MGMGLRLFKGINNIEAARDRVFTLVEHLHSRCLVSKGEAFLTVHDVVRDVSKSIATEKGSLVLEQGVTLKMSLDQTSPKHFTRISIISNEIRELPSQLQFPKLELFRSTNVVLDFPDSCFEGMVKLQVLDINFYYRKVPKLPSSLQSVTNLHTLCLQNCRLEDFTVIKYLQNLEILRITDKDIEELPKEIGQLTKLRLLDMSYCKSLKRISPGIISGLTVLEELYLGGYGIDWGAEENEEGRIAAHKEFESLSNLYVLHIVIKDPSFLPLFTNLKKYKIQIGRVEYIYGSQNYERTLSISGVALEKDFKFLLHNSEALLLKGESTKNLVYELVREASQSIKCLEISETETPEYLANVMDRTKAPFLVSTLESLKLERLDNLKQIINGPLVPGNFAKLKKLRVSKCKQLRNIFRLSNAVDVLDRERMEEVIWWEGREEEANRKLQFPNLKELDIDGESLISFCKGANEIEFPQLEEMILKSLPAVKTFFPPKVLFPKLVTMHLWNFNKMKEIVDGPLEAGSLEKLKELNVGICNQLRNIFRLPTETDTVHLETLKIEHCKSMKEVIKWEGREEYATSKLNFPKLWKLEIRFSGVICFCRGAKEIEFHQLRELELRYLRGVDFLISSSNENPLKSMFPNKVLFPRLNEMKLKLMRNVKEIWCDLPQAGSFCNLGKLYIEGCDSLEYVFSPFMATYLVHLHTLSIRNCPSLKEVIDAEKDKDVEKEYSSGILPKLQSVALVGMSALGRFCHIVHDLEFHVLSSVLVINCPEFKTFAPGIVHAPNLKHVNIDEDKYHVNPGSETLWKENLNNTVQHLYEDAICFVVIRPFSKITYRRINQVVAELLWLELVWLVDWWAGVQIKLFTDSETFELMGKEHALLICNHRSDIDWLVGWVMAQRSGCLGSTVAIMKKILKFLPVIGWSMWFSEYLFLERSWAKDEITLESGLERLRDFPGAFWVALFVEGTRFTKDKLLAAQEYAVSAKLPVPRNVLIPRTKGFVSAVKHLRSFTPAIYDVTVAIPKSSPPPTMIRLFRGKSSVVHVYLERKPMKDLPETDDSIAQWCKDTFVEKDKLLDKHNVDDTFSEQQQDLGRPWMSLAVVISWSSLLIIGIIEFCRWTSLLSTWKGIAFTATGLAIITLLMQFLIQFSQSELSTPVKTTSAKRTTFRQPLLT